MGAEGQLLAITGSGGHVRWASGGLTYEQLDDLVSTATYDDTTYLGRTQYLGAARQVDDLAFSLEFGHTASVEDEDDLLADNLGGDE